MPTDYTVELSVPEAARRSNVPESVVRYAIIAGRVPKIRRDGRVFIPRDAWDVWAAQRVRQ
jgi:hypothetical protein